MYMTYSHTNNSRSLHRSTAASKGMTSNSHYTKAFFRFLIIAVILGTVFFFGAMVQAYAASSSPASTNVSAHTASKAVHEQVVIQAGDTLWDIAAAHKKNGENTRSYVDKIRTKNHLTTSSLKEGQVLLLP
ncbi:LysM peptidoglycan-binding domain-containing protein [Paenibacillus aceris]|uniref:Cell division protein YceG involved in septum cleavage n=1 Tax=Paenibacillus aceris TaxID=869555 RepID=A0ABS4HT57_9BACL|nr:LysM peptidoglycan-binding domain-containing protein [Paenibacillus aceris]MBP1961807.1 cell division protein YceG involved in septum cleavage [Paenibacillus aceris]NHW34336.1 LysM peptidoglycan-binding domain-containing protein [Paenibacillus aceris]